MKKISNKFLNLRRNLARRENLYRGNLVSKITNLDDSASTKYWEVNSAQKETDKRIRDKDLSPKKRLKFDHDFMKPNEGLLNNNNLSNFSPIFNKKTETNNPYSLFSGDVKKNYDNIFINHLNNNNNNISRPSLNKIDNFKTCGSSFNVTSNFNQSNLNSMNNNGFNNNNSYQPNVRIIRAEDYIKNVHCDVSPLNKTQEFDVISLDEVNPSLAKYIIRNDQFNNKCKFEEKKDNSSKPQESKNILEDLIPKKLNFNEKKPDEKNDEIKQSIQDSFNSFAIPKENKKEVNENLNKQDPSCNNNINCNLDKNKKLSI